MRIVVEILRGGNAVRLVRAQREGDVVAVLGKAETAGTRVVHHAAECVVEQTAEDEYAAAVQHQLAASAGCFSRWSGLLGSIIVGDTARSATTALQPAGRPVGTGLQSEGRRTKHRHREHGEAFVHRERGLGDGVISGPFRGLEINRSPRGFTGE